MEKITRNVRDLNKDERRLYEGVIGHKLAENQQIILQVITVDAAAHEPEHSEDGGDAGLPAWTRVYQGLTDEEVGEVEKVVLQRSDLTRPSE